MSENLASKTKLPEPFRAYGIRGVTMVALSRGHRCGDVPPRYAFDEKYLAEIIEEDLGNAYLTGYFRGYRAAMKEAL